MPPLSTSLPSAIPTPPQILTHLTTATTWVTPYIQTNSTHIHIQTQRAISIYLSSVNASTGLIPAISYWQCANGYSAMALHDLWAGVSENRGVLRENLITVLQGGREVGSGGGGGGGGDDDKDGGGGGGKQQKREVRALATREAGFINVFNDDSMWWALAALDTVALSDSDGDGDGDGTDERLVKAARDIWTHVSRYQLVEGTGVKQKTGAEDADGEGEGEASGKGEGKGKDGIDMSGGVLWTSERDEENVNVITTGLFAELGARLAVFETAEGNGGGGDGKGKRERYLKGAQAALGWIARNRVEEVEGEGGNDANALVVMDTISLKTGKRKDWSFTYNAGQTIAGAVAVYEALGGSLELGVGLPSKQTSSSSSSTSSSTTTTTTKKARTADHAADSHNTADLEKKRKEYLDLALSLARSALTRYPKWVDADGTLTERSVYPGPNNKTALQNNDAVGFKSVLLRSLVKLYRLLSREGVEGEIQQMIRAFAQWQWVSLMERARDWGAGEGEGEGDGERDRGVKMQSGPWWAGPWDTPTSHSQMAALDGMAGLWGVTERGPV